MSEQQPTVQKIQIPGIPDGYLTEIDGEFQLTTIQVGDQEVSVDAFLAMLEGGLELSEIVVSRDEKRSKTKYETYSYFTSWKMNATPTMKLVDLVPEGPQRAQARKMLGRMITKRIKEIEEFLSRAIHSAQQKDGIQPYWRADQKPIF